MTSALTATTAGGTIHYIIVYLNAAAPTLCGTSTSLRTICSGSDIIDMLTYFCKDSKRSHTFPTAGTMG